MEFLSDVSVIQWIFLGLGAVLVFPLLWENVKDKIPSWDDVKPKPKPTPDPVVDVANPPNLTQIVRQWERLMESCEERKLWDACKKLDEVFPLLIAAREDEVEIDDE